jgi:predicted nucleic acid-binding protein
MVIWMPCAAIDMIIVDTSAWIEYFRDGTTTVVQKVAHNLEHELIGIGDLIYCEIMQGISSARERRVVSELLLSLPQYEMVGFQMAGRSAANYSMLRTRGITVRKTIDVLIGTFCAENGYGLIHHDRDFDLMANHIGLQVV